LTGQANGSPPGRKERPSRKQSIRRKKEPIARGAVIPGKKKSWFRKRGGDGKIDFGKPLKILSRSWEKKNVIPGHNNWEGESGKSFRKKENCPGVLTAARDSESKRTTDAKKFTRPGKEWGKNGVRVVKKQRFRVKKNPRPKL